MLQKRGSRATTASTWIATMKPMVVQRVPRFDPWAPGFAAAGPVQGLGPADAAAAAVDEGGLAGGRGLLGGLMRWPS
jgi:hypothetical protein